MPGNRSRGDDVGFDGVCDSYRSFNVGGGGASKSPTQRFFKGFKLQDSFIVVMLIIILSVIGIETMMQLSGLLYSCDASEVKEVPVVIDAFLSDYIANGWNVRGMDCNAFTKYFVDADENMEENFSEYEVSFVEDEISTVFESLTTKPSAYKVEPVVDGFCIIRLMDEYGDTINPPIGFWFTLTDDESKIDNWAVARLLPFSKYDDDYSEGWDNLYG